MRVARQLTAPNDIHSIYFPKMGTVNCLVTSILLYSLYIHYSYRFRTTWGWVSNEQNKTFWVNYPFKSMITMVNIDDESTSY